MKKSDIFRLRKLVTLQQQAAALSYKKALAEQQALRQTATDLIRESYSRLEDNAASTISAGDLRAIDQYRMRLRSRAHSLLEGAAELESSIEALRSKTTVTLGREAAMEKLVHGALKKLRAEANEREEASREQIVLEDY